MQIEEPIRVAILGSYELETDFTFYKIKGLVTDLIQYHIDSRISVVSTLKPFGIESIVQRLYAEAIENTQANMTQLEVYVTDNNVIDRSELPLRGFSYIVDSSITEVEDYYFKLLLGDNYSKRISKNILQKCKKDLVAVLGKDLTNPVDAILCWSPNASLVNCLKTPVMLAQKLDIPVFNLGSNFDITQRAYKKYIETLTV